MDYPNLPDPDMNMTVTLSVDTVTELLDLHKAERDRWIDVVELAQSIRNDSDKNKHTLSIASQMLSRHEMAIATLNRALDTGTDDITIDSL